MATELWGVLLGAAIASLIPLITLRQTEKRWRIEKRMEILRLKRDHVEAMYAEIMGRMPEMLQSATYSSNITSKISVRASQEFRDLYFGQIEKKERDELKLKHLYLDMTLAANRHVANIDKEIDDSLS
jgi:hypothetical protein